MLNPWNHHARWTAAIIFSLGCSETVTPRTDSRDVAPGGDVAVGVDAQSARDATTPPDAAVRDVTGPDVQVDAAAMDVPPTPDADPPDAAAVMDAGASDAGPTDASPTTDSGPTVNRELPGPNAVEVWTGAVPGTSGSARVFYPTTAGAERYPLVVFAHGFQLAVNNYDLLLRHIASYGYVVASVDYPNSLFSFDHRNVPAALTAARQAFGEGRVAGFPGAMRVDASRAVAMGHSAGGKGTVMAVLSDPGFIAGLTLDPVDDNPSPGGTITDATPSVAPERMAMLRRPIGFVGTSLGRCMSFGTACAPEASNWFQFVISAPMDVPHPFWVLNNFGHNDALDPGCIGACSFCVSGGAAIDPQRRALRAISVAFLDRYTRNDVGAQSLLDGPARAAYVTAGTLWNGTMSGLSRCP